jgi:hypothetical protein
MFETRRRRGRAAPVAALAAVLLTAAAARADQIVVDLPAVPDSVIPLGSNLTVRLANVPGSAAAYTTISSNLVGLINWRDHVTHQAYRTFCLELTQNVWTPSTNDVYNLVGLAAAPNPNVGPINNGAVYGPTGLTKAQAIHRLWAAEYPAILAGTPLDQAAFQVAQWKLTYDGPGNVDLSSGNFQALLSDNPALKGVVTEAQGWLNGLFVKDIGLDTSAFDAQYKLVAWTSPTLQDQLEAVTVPAPPALLLAGIGAFGLTGYGWLRRRL